MHASNFELLPTVEEIDGPSVSRVHTGGGDDSAVLEPNGGADSDVPEPNEDTTRDEFEWRSRLAAFAHAIAIVCFVLFVNLWGTADGDMLNAVRLSEVRYRISWFGVADIHKNHARHLAGHADAVDQIAQQKGCVRVRGQCQVPFLPNSEPRGRFGVAVVTWHAISFIEHGAIAIYLSGVERSPSRLLLWFFFAITAYFIFGLIFSNSLPKDWQAFMFLALDALSGIPLGVGCFLGFVGWLIAKKNENELFAVRSVRWLSYGITASIMTGANYAFTWESTSVEMLILFIGLVWIYILCGATDDLLKVVARDAETSLDALLPVRVAIFTIGCLAFVASFIPAFAYAGLAADRCTDMGDYGTQLKLASEQCGNTTDFYGGDKLCNDSAPMIVAFLTTIFKFLFFLDFPVIKFWTQITDYFEHTTKCMSTLWSSFNNCLLRRCPAIHKCCCCCCGDTSDTVTWNEEMRFAVASIFSKVFLTVMFVLLFSLRDHDTLVSENGYLHGTTSSLSTSAGGGSRYACNLLMNGTYDVVTLQ